VSLIEAWTFKTWGCCFVETCSIASTFKTWVKRVIKFGNVGSWFLVIGNLESSAFVWWMLIKEGNHAPWVLSLWIEPIEIYANLTRTYRDTTRISWDSNESCKVLSSINILGMLDGFNSS
jgi:hypothetical protein